jgi:hypothetical protein
MTQEARLPAFGGQSSRKIVNLERPKPHPGWQGVSRQIGAFVPTCLPIDSHQTASRGVA